MNELLLWYNIGYYVSNILFSAMLIVSLLTFVIGIHGFYAGHVKKIMIGLSLFLLTGWSLNLFVKDLSSRKMTTAKNLAVNQCFTVKYEEETLNDIKEEISFFTKISQEYREEERSLTKAGFFEDAKSSRESAIRNELKLKELGKNINNTPWEIKIKGFHNDDVMIVSSYNNKYTRYFPVYLRDYIVKSTKCSDNIDRIDASLSKDLEGITSL